MEPEIAEAAKVLTTTVSSLSENGTIGVIILLIILVGGAFYLLFKFATNHVEHANAAFEKVADSNVEIAKSMTGLTKVIENKIK